LNHGPGPHANTPLTAKLVTREGLLANANWVYQQAANANIFQGEAPGKPSRVQLQALTDILNGWGWNAGLRSTTKSHVQTAWWNETQAWPATVFHTLSTRYQSDEDIRQLFHLARANSHQNALPCKSQPGRPSHRYHAQGRSPFRVRCSDRECHHKLQRADPVHWIAQLVDTGHINREVLNLGKEEEGDLLAE